MTVHVTHILKMYNIRLFQKSEYLNVHFYLDLYIDLYLFVMIRSLGSREVHYGGR